MSRKDVKRVVKFETLKDMMNTLRGQKGQLRMVTPEPFYIKYFIICDGNDR